MTYESASPLFCAYLRVLAAHIKTEVPEHVRDKCSTMLSYWLLTLPRPDDDELVSWLI